MTESVNDFNSTTVKPTSDITIDVPHHQQQKLIAQAIAAKERAYCMLP